MWLSPGSSLSDFISYRGLCGRKSGRAAFVSLPGVERSGHVGLTPASSMARRPRAVSQDSENVSPPPPPSATLHGGDSKECQCTQAKTNLSFPPQLGSALLLSLGTELYRDDMSDVLSVSGKAGDRHSSGNSSVSHQRGHLPRESVFFPRWLRKDKGPQALRLRGTWLVPVVTISL